MYAFLLLLLLLLLLFLTSTAPGIHLFVNIGKFGRSYFRDLQRIVLKLHRLTKYSTINRFMETNFCFNENH